jgi:hypothetical protein
MFQNSHLSIKNFASFAGTRGVAKNESGLNIFFLDTL